jgi:hypothetical protein
MERNQTGRGEEYDSLHAHKLLTEPPFNHNVQLALYDEMAKKDTERYKRDMEIFYKEELAMMCSGNAGSSPDNGDKKPSAAVQHQVTETTSSAAPTLASPLLAAGQATAFSSMTTEQIAQVFNMFQQQGHESINKEEIIIGVNAERVNIKHRLLTILRESEALQTRDRLLEQLVNSIVMYEPRLALAQAAFPGVNGIGNRFGIPAFGQFGSLSEGALLSQLVASQQLQQQLPSQAANQSPAPPSATQLSTSGNVTNQTQPSTLAAAPPGLASLSQQVNLHDALLLNQYLALQQQHFGSAPARSDDPKPKNDDSFN